MEIFKNQTQFLNNLQVKSAYHPIINARSGLISGVEALARFPEIPDCNPEHLFRYARKAEQALEVDRKCRQAALLGFQTIPKDNNLLLFLNLDCNIFRPDVIGSQHLINAVKKSGINPEGIVIEILENRANDIDSLKKFIDEYRALGFLIAIDDIGSGHSNLNRISIIKPDIIKLDRFLVTDIDHSHHKKAVVHSLVDLAQRIGALIVGEGIERREEAFTLLDLGVDLFQGFLFGKPMPPEQITNPETTNRINNRMNELREHNRQKAQIRQEYLQELRQTTKNIRITLQLNPSNQKELLLQEAIKKNRQIIAIYTLNSDGIQNSPTIGKTNLPTKSGLFSPASKGTDQSLKPYYLNLQYSSKKYISEPYVSLADGHICRTCSVKFKNRDGNSEVLCVDYKSEQD